MKIHIWTLFFDANELQVKLLEQQKMEEELEKFSRPKQEAVVSEEFPKQISNNHKLNENMQLKLKMCDESRPKDVIDGEDVCSELSDTTLSSSSSSILTSERVVNRRISKSTTTISCWIASSLIEQITTFGVFCTYLWSPITDRN